jgi:deoxyribodipyrimidine photo-lyase
MVERERIRQLNTAVLRSHAKYVLYWSQMNRRVDANHALLYAVELANERKLPVLYYEGLTCSYPFANDRMHTFILQAFPRMLSASGRLASDIASICGRIGPMPTTSSTGSRLMQRP